MKTGPGKPSKPTGNAEKPISNKSDVELSDTELDKGSGGMRKAGGDPQSAGKPFLR